MNENNIVLGVDIGGSHITCAQIDLQKEQIIAGTKISSPVNSKGSKEEIIDVWVRIIKESFTNKVKPSLIGVAMPGPFDYDAGICLMRGVGKYDSIYGLDVKKLFAEAAGIKMGNVKFLNDASCFALGEFYAGAGKGLNRMIGITLGTGFGSSLIVDGKIVDEGAGVPEGGMFWNVPYKDGIADDYFSTRWFEGEYYKKSGVRKKGVYEIANNIETDDNARKLFDEFSKNLTEFLFPWIERFKPDVVVTGGGISKSHYLFLPSLQRELFKKGIKTEIRISELWEDAALIGSGNLFKSN